LADYYWNGHTNGATSSSIHVDFWGSRRYERREVQDESEG